MEGHKITEALWAAKHGNRIYWWSPDCKDWIPAKCTKATRSDIRQTLQWRDAENCYVPITDQTENGWAIDGCTYGSNEGPCEFCRSCPELDTEEHGDSEVDTPHDGCVAMPVEERDKQLFYQVPFHDNACYRLDKISACPRWTGLFGYELPNGIMHWSVWSRKRWWGDVFWSANKKHGTLLTPDYVEMQEAGLSSTRKTK